MARQVERRSRFAWRLVSAGIVVFLIVSGFAATQPQPASEDWKVFDRPGKFITALFAAADALWIGTEDMGLWRLDLLADPSKPDAWRQFTICDGLGDDSVYAVACDRMGRIWVGLQNHGVAVYNGTSWHTYDVLEGPIGERVFGIACSHTDGDIWIATSAGLTRYSVLDDAWWYYNRRDGLPSDQICAVAVDPLSGRVWAGTECDGLAWSDPPYKKWTCVRAVAERSGDSGEAPGLAGGTGPGLPSNLSNDLLVLQDGTVVYSTNYGLGMGRGGGSVWMGWQGLSKQPYANYCRGLAEDPSGRLWIATRHLGLARLDGRTGELKSYRKAWRPESKAGEPPEVPPSLPDDYVFDVAVTGGGDVWAGTYGGGLARLKGAAPAARSASSRSAVSANPQSPSSVPRSEFRVTSSPLPSPAVLPRASTQNLPLPAPLRPPTTRILKQITEEVERAESARSAGGETSVVVMPDDWRTKGDWIDRYGRFSAVLCAMGGGGNDQIGGYHAAHVECRGWIGRNSIVRNDQLRRWVHWITTDNPRSLQCLSFGGRKQSEWDDHGEAMPQALDGPHIYATLKVPPGRYYLSLYFFNKDGLDGSNRLRDYTITVKITPMKDQAFPDLGLPGHDMEAWFNQCPGGARSRVRDFWGGVYKRFYVDTGKERYVTIKVGRNHSFNTLLCGIFLDPLGDMCGREGPYRMPAPKRPLRKYDETEPNLKDPYRLGLRLLDHLLCLREARPSWYAARSWPYLLETSRLLVDMRSGKPRSAGDIAYCKSYVQPLRKDMAGCLNDLHLFDLRDKTFYDLECYDSFVWSEKTRLGKAWEEYAWDKEKFQKFTREKKEQETW